MQCNTILIIEDDADIRESLALALTLEGYTVRTAENGREGLDILPTIETPCLILLDLMMPVMDGRAFSNAVCKDVALATIPIILITAFHDNLGDIKGIRKVVKKPVHFDLLMSVVREYCGSV